MSAQPCAVPLLSATMALCIPRDGLLIEERLALQAIGNRDATVISAAELDSLRAELEAQTFSASIRAANLDHAKSLLRDLLVALDSGNRDALEAAEAAAVDLLAGP